MRFSLESFGRSRLWVILAAAGFVLGLGLFAAAYAGPIAGRF